MADELMIGGTPWWRGVNMAKIEEAQRLSQSQTSPVRPVSPAVSAGAPLTSLPPPTSSTPQPASAAAPVAPLSFVPQRRTEMPVEDTMEGGERLEIDMNDSAPPVWYKDIGLDKVKRAPRIPPGIEEHLNKITSGIKKINEAAAKNMPPTATELKKINDGIHKAFFLDLSALAIRQKGLLHNDRGLPQIFNSDKVEYPWYIKEDAAELYIKWWQKDTNPDLFRGIKLGRTKNAKIGRESAADKLDPKYPRKKGDFHGNGHLRNGQWWPTQLCAVRDGAHSATVAGICGRTGEGAFSCVMSGGSYPNIDKGTEVWYYGTESDDPSRPSDSTQHMIESCRLQTLVRVLRASKMTTEGSNDYKPKEGMRYDGLYKVASYEVKNVAKQVHLFHLVREPDQGPIRNSGPEVRPTPEELEALAKAKIEKKFLA
ncbi:hypothetical protein E4T48_01214 [Aureobasidium sp. EXF-10727]|nr:hypothetical protein E4T48_01214 [Aureobasidium sp. EXF-10727]KAI4731133.1 hypothetical protein E4T49_00926 [Aureobasidium sp. EXF-10728]